MKYRVLHHTAVSREERPSQLASVERYHKGRFYSQSKLGYWTSYNGFIDGDGLFTQTRLIGEETFAVIGHNCDKPETCDAVSFCLAMNGEKELLNDVQKKTLRALYRGEIPLKTMPNFDFNIKWLEDKFHRDLQVDRVCPGKLITH